jgi:hypothetical protein
MSCLGPNYLISTTNPWYRRQSGCTDVTNYIANNLKPNDTIYVPILKKYVLISKLDDVFKMYKKGNTLQYDYIHHTNKLTKNQTYALIAKGKGGGKKGYATQSDTYTDPNNNHLKRVNYDVINFETGAQTTEPITCPTFTPKTPVNVLPINNNTPSVVPNILPPPPPTPSNNKFTLPDIKPVVDVPKNINIPDGGNLVIGTISNICTGETKIICDIDPIVCFPSSASNVPSENGVDKELCYTKGTPTWFVKSRINTSTTFSDNKFPANFKGLTSANSIVSRRI